MSNLNVTPHKSECPAATGQNAKQKSLADTSNFTVIPDGALAPTVARWGSQGFWSLIVLRCPHCKQRHFHGGGAGVIPTFGHRAAHCNSVDIYPDYTLVELDLPRWAGLMGVAQTPLAQWSLQAGYSTVPSLDRKFRLPIGTAEQSLLASLEPR